MANNVETAHRFGDLALIQQALQACYEETENFLSVQCQLANKQMTIDLTNPIDIRLEAVSSLNHLMIKQSPLIQQEFGLTKSLSTCTSVDANTAEQLLVLKQLLKHTQQTIDLLNNIQRYTKDTLIKKNFDLISEQLSLSYHRTKAMHDILISQTEGTIKS
ncbi:hypothetical protein Q4489_00995 [Thalassotalea sp. 1_MG-2023]|uniref:hypothetical protein n=1 Tax=Thalassotalea sp. 1_MG-2023 TaxID=3062680 RepID=UPI0026E1ED36|nr:hypothetical protein [Thalassotalea sp. 1_MG-2023]MDO6425566.1 hypothetical protein [Thalassotalea sp. 1_MG-2023]